MRTVHKFTLLVRDEVQEIVMPIGTRILTVQNLRENLMLWAELDTDQPPGMPRKIAVYGTGHPILASATTVYIGTVQMREGWLVWHVFELLD